MNENILPENAVEIIRGSSKTLQLTVTDQSNKPVNLTGARVLFTVKFDAEDPRPLFQKVSDHASQILVTNAKGGVAQIYLGPQDTKNLLPRDYIFDVWVVLSSGATYPVVLPTTFVVQPGVTLIP